MVCSGCAQCGVGGEQFGESTFAGLTCHWSLVSFCVGAAAAGLRNNHGIILEPAKVAPSALANPASAQTVLVMWPRHQRSRSSAQCAGGGVPKPRQLQARAALRRERRKGPHPPTEPCRMRRVCPRRENHHGQEPQCRTRRGPGRDRRRY
jgi:hypothetical protein